MAGGMPEVARGAYPLLAARCGSPSGQGPGAHTSPSLPGGDGTMEAQGC